MARYHGITTPTYQNLVIDSGAVYKNYGEAGQLLLGATRGGNTFVIETEYREMEVDGARGPVKGSRRITRVNAMITANFLQLDADLLVLGLPGAAATDSPVVTPTHDLVARSLQIALSDYLTNITIVGQLTGDSTDPVIVSVNNALCDGNIEFGFVDKDETVIPIQFTAHFDPSDLDSEPWVIKFPQI